jgi:K+-sensing histidine kinase KdpD
MLQVAGNSDELAFSIVHDLRNPLSAICGCAELLVTANLDPEQTRRIAGNIRRAGEQMKTLLTSIVSVAKGAPKTSKAASSAKYCRQRLTPRVSLDATT